ncbi:MAG: OprO/OprP family phosphate-selective porin [Porticoccus sp.]
MYHRITYTLTLLVFSLVAATSYAENTLKDATSFESEDGNFTFKLKGRIHADALYFDDDVTEIDDRQKLRRLRAGFSGTVMEDWTYSYSYDTESDVGYRIKGAHIGYKGFDKVKISVGNLQQPFSLEELTSSNYIPFMERSLANTFAPSFGLGLLVKTWGDHWSFAGGYFDDNLADRHNDNEGSHSFAARVTVNPIDKSKFKVHLGASTVFRNVGSSQTVSYGARPDGHASDIKILYTGTLDDVDDTQTYGLEAALIKGPWLLQGELMRMELDRKTHADPTFDGGYIQGSWIITGEKHQYSGKNGAFKQIKPKSPYGAVEMAVRYSTVDLEDKTVTGGEGDNLTLGINWHINRNIRLMANYVQADASPNSDGIDEDIDILEFRFQAYF